MREMPTAWEIDDDNARKDAVQRAAELMSRAADADAEMEIAAITEAIAEYDMRRDSGVLTLSVKSNSASRDNS